jgi:class 3 adenylate cyclase
MPAPSFRLKLLLAMMFTVAAVAGVTLFITQRKVHAAYEKVFNERIESQITYLPKEQETRLAMIKERCADLVRKNVRILAALTDGDTNMLYRVARDELQRILRPGEPLEQNPPPPAPPQGPRADSERPRKPPGALFNKAMDARGKAAAKGFTLPGSQRAAMFVAFLDAEGRVLPDPGSAAAAIPREQVSEMLARLGRALGSLTNQHIGYTGLASAGRSGLLLELVATPIVDETENKTAGALVLGFPFLDLGERTISEVSDIQNGIFLDGKLYSHTITNEARTTLMRLLPAELEANPDPRPDFIIEAGRIPHRVFYTPLNPGSPLGVAWKVGLYSWESALRAQRELRAQTLGFAVIALVIALGISLVISHSLSVPINELVGGTAHIRAGDFGIKVPVRSTDEIGQLARSFNEMAEGLALKEKYLDVLVKVTDKDVAAQLLDGQLALGGELREVTVLFCDIRGFTAMTQNMDPAEVVAMLNNHMTAMTRLVNEHHGVVDKFIGDSVMALFGAPKSYGGDALNAVRCADAMQRERKALNEIVPRKLHLGIGIATGQVLAGNMGSENRSNYTVIGERVNLASRLCSVAGRGDVVISQATREQLGDQVAVEEMEPLGLKGFDSGVTAFRLVEVCERKGEPAKEEEMRA